MKSIVLATAIAAVLAGPALAAPNKMTHNVRHTQQQLRDSNAAVTANDPIGVYVNGQEVGRDPDPNIRSEILRDYYVQQGDMTNARGARLSQAGATCAS